MVKFSDIQDAFLFVSSGDYGQATAVLCKDTGEIFYRSELAGIDEIEDEDLDLDMCVEVPHKNDFDLGQRLVFEFVETYMPDGYDQVRQMFRRRGAYGCFKDLLERVGLLQRWYDFSARWEEEALREWCRENEIELSG